MSHEGELNPAGHVRTTPDPPAVRAPGNAAPQTAAQIDGLQLVQWLTVQEGDMAGTIHHGGSSPDLSHQLHTRWRNNLEMKQMLQNQTLAIETFQHK